MLAIASPSTPSRNPSFTNVGAEESPWRLKDQTSPCHLLARFDQLLGRERRVAVHGLQMLRQRIASEVQQVRIQVPDAALHFHRLMHEIPYPLRFPPMVQPHLAVRIPARVANPPPQIMRHAAASYKRRTADRVSSPARSRLQRLAQRFIRVERKNPLMRGLLSGEVFLLGVARPRDSPPRARPASRAISTVRSVEPLSITTISSAQRRLSIARGRFRSSL